MSDSLKQLKADAAETLERGMTCDRLVLRAIGLGIDTRARIRETIGFDYAAIEKALERESGAVRMISSGPIDKFVLAGASGNGSTTQSFNPWPRRERDKPERKDMAITDADRRSAQKAGVSLDVPGTSKPVQNSRRGPTYKELDLAEIEETMATEETMEKAARKLGLTVAQLYVRRNKDQAVDSAVSRGRARYYESAPEVDIDPDEKESVSPVGYIEEKPESDVRAATSPETIAEVRDRIAPQSCENLIDGFSPAVAAAAADLQRQMDAAEEAEQLAAIKRTSEIISAPQTPESMNGLVSCDVEGRIHFHIDVKISPTRMSTWSPENISEFFTAISKIVYMAR